MGTLNFLHAAYYACGILAFVLIVCLAIRKMIVDSIYSEKRKADQLDELQDDVWNLQSRIEVLELEDKKKTNE